MIFKEKMGGALFYSFCSVALPANIVAEMAENISVLKLDKYGDH
jgi:hypothetical protein